jgi:hypothetical protein
LSSTHSIADDLADRVLPLRDQARIIDEVLAERLNEVVPMLMRREGIDAWVIISREYNEDPILKTMLPATWLNARRRTVLMFIDHGDSRGVERMAVARYAVADLFPGVWNPEEQPDQWARIADLLAEANPQRIALNYSDDYGLADGLAHTEYREFTNALPDQLRGRVESAEALAVGWLETRTEREMELYADVMAIAHGIIREGFSAEVVTPGVTTLDDLSWWFRQRVNDLGLSTWFHTGMEVERSAESQQRIENEGLNPEVLYRGDHVHIDFGISYLRLQTDTQQNAYILREGETEVPEYLQAAKREGNRLQDILTSHFQNGRSGNEILRLSLEQAREEGLRPIIYTHPIGLHGHAAGTTIGMWDQQDGVPGSGDYLMQPNTAYSIELNALVDIPEWGPEPLPMKLEEDGFWNGATFRYIQPRQTEYHVIDPN